MGTMSIGEERSVFELINAKIKHPPKRIHFVGIGGVSMRGLAAATALMGHRVSGSDRDARVLDLLELGISVSVGHTGEESMGADLVVRTHAVSDGCPAIACARERGIAVVSRAEYLGALMMGYNRRIGVSGSHGKSTVTAMLSKIYESADKNPTVFAGANLRSGRPYILGGREVLIAEACEYRNSFLSFPLDTALILNIEYDHPDFFTSRESLERSFFSFAERAGKAIVNIDSPACERLFFGLKNRKISFSMLRDADYRYKITRGERGERRVTLYRRAREILRANLSVFGDFNATNAAAAAVAAFEEGLDAEKIKRGLEGFSGLSRRLELIGRLGECAVYYDYAHHPTEIAAAIGAVREMTGGEVTVVFKPHTFTRTKALYSDFVSALRLADRVLICEIFGARESAIEGINSEALAVDIGEGAIAVKDSEILSVLPRLARGSIILMGAGDFGDLPDKIMAGGK